MEIGHTTKLAGLVMALAASAELKADNRVNNLVVESRHDMAEINNFYDEEGNAVFDQIIIYDWNDSKSRLDVTDWRLIKTDCVEVEKEIGGVKKKFKECIPTIKGSSMIPHRKPNGGYQSIWHDGHTLRKTSFRTVAHTWTQYDPELEARKTLSKECRSKLPKRHCIKN